MKNLVVNYDAVFGIMYTNVQSRPFTFYVFPNKAKVKKIGNDSIPYHLRRKKLT